MPESKTDKKGIIGIIGSGPAGLFAAWALRNDGYKVVILEKHDSLALAGHSYHMAGGSTVDIPMRTFSGTYYSNLLQTLKYLGIKRKVHQFNYKFEKEGFQYFEFFSNFHRILPCFKNGFRLNAYIMFCYLWYTIAVLLFPPRIESTHTSHCMTETLEQYAKRIHLPKFFLDWYLLPLFSSVATCTHDDILSCPAAYIATYRKGTFGADHQTVSSMRVLQERLTLDTSQEVHCDVHSVKPQDGRVVVQCTKSDKGGVRTMIFDHVIIATSAARAGNMYPDIIPITSELREGQVRIELSRQSWIDKRRMSHGSSEPLILNTNEDSRIGYITHSTHFHPSGMKITVFASPESGNEDSMRGSDHVVHLCRPLPTPQSHHVLLSVFGKHSDKRSEGWRSGDGQIYLAGGYAHAGLPLLEACIRSGFEAAVAIGAKLPFEIKRQSPF